MQLILLTAPNADATWFTRLAEAMERPVESRLPGCRPPGTPGTPGTAGSATRQIQLLNTQVFATLQATWYHVENLSPGDDPSVLPRLLTSRIRACAENLNRFEHWSCNDPAMCLLAPHWQAHIPEPRYLIFVEHPWDVAARLRDTWRFPIAFGLGLWEFYMRAALANTQHCRRLLVSQETLAREPGKTLCMIGQQLGVIAQDDCFRGAAAKRIAALVPATRAGRDTEYPAYMTTSRLALYRALRTGRVDALDVGLLAPASRDILQMYGRLRAGFDSVRRERDELRRRALKESPPAASDTEAAEPSGPPESGADATGVTDLTDVTIHFRNMNTLNLYCLGDNPVLEHLVQALARAGETGSDQEMFYLEADGKTFYFPVSQLLAVEANGEILSATDAPTSAARTRPGSGHQAVSGFHSISPRKSVAVLVLGCLLPEYEVCLDVIQRTWATERFADIDVYYAFGGHFDRMAVSATSIEKYIGDGAPALRAFQTRLAGNVITCGCADTIHLQTDSLLRKRLIAFSHFARERRYDFVYSVCASSYVDQARLREYVESVDGKLLLHGPVGVCEFTGRPYVSGASTLLSIDMIDRLVGNAYRILEQNHGRYADDVALGSWIARHVSDTSETRIVQNIRAGRRATGDNTFVAPGARSMIDYVGVDPVSQIPVAGAYHYHFKTDTIGQMMDFHRQFFE